MYGQYGYSGYQPTINGYQNAYQQQYAQPNTLPQQQILQANGKASIDALRMAPNSSVLVMDNTAPMVWLCTSDSLGNVTSVAYDIAPHKDAVAVETANLETRVAAIEASVQGLFEQMEALNNGTKSNVGGIKSKQVVRNVGADTAD